MRTQEEFREFEQWLHDSPGHRHATAVGFGALGDEVDMESVTGNNVHKKMTRGRLVLQDDRIVFLPARMQKGLIVFLAVSGMIVLLTVGTYIGYHTGKTPFILPIVGVMGGYFALNALSKRALDPADTQKVLLAARDKAAFSIPLNRIPSVSVTFKKNMLGRRLSVLEIAYADSEQQPRTALLATRATAMRTPVDFDTHQWADLIHAATGCPVRTLD